MNGANKKPESEWIPAFGMLGRKKIEGLGNEKAKKA